MTLKSTKLLTILAAGLLAAGGCSVYPDDGYYSESYTYYDYDAPPPYYYTHGHYYGRDGLWRRYDWDNHYVRRGDRHDYPNRFDRDDHRYDGARDHVNPPSLRDQVRSERGPDRGNGPRGDTPRNDSPRNNDRPRGNDRPSSPPRSGDAPRPSSPNRLPNGPHGGGPQ
ncbi:MAG: hypothetical protein QM770_18950 [Tepidisphaeraceae bacterium]